MNKAYDYLIVGAGLFGSVFAHEARKAGKRCLVIDKRHHTGGNIYCEQVEGIAVHRYGAHIFHTDNREVWDYATSLVEFNRFTNSPLANFEGRLYNLPFNMNTFYQLWGVRTPAEAQAKIAEQRAKYAHITEPANLEEQALTLCGDDIYRILIKGYTEKQWGRAATELPAFIIHRVPFRFTFDNNYFNDRFQGIPCGGYNALTDALLNGIEVRTGCDYLADRAQLDALADRILFTGCIDAFYDFRHGHLDYRSLRFEHKVMECPDFREMPWSTTPSAPCLTHVSLSTSTSTSAHSPTPWSPMSTLTTSSLARSLTIPSTTSATPRFMAATATWLQASSACSSVAVWRATPMPIWTTP